jgi:hypothetical protein
MRLLSTAGFILRAFASRKGVKRGGGGKLQSFLRATGRYAR